MYQLTMAYAYWKAGKAHDDAVFDLFFRRSPFQGEYTVFAGLEECVRFAAHFRFRPDDLRYLRQVMPPHCEARPLSPPSPTASIEAFFDYLAALDCSGVRIDAVPEGYVVFPRTPLIRASGPLLVVQLLETHFLTLVNYASLVATNAARYRRVAGPKKVLLEFGLRRAQGPDGGLSASRYTYVGGCDATSEPSSNVEAGRRFGIPVRGTHSHAFVSSFMSLDEVASRPLPSADGSRECSDFAASACGWLAKMQANSELNHQFSETNASELASFVAYALAFPTAFQALVDTYDVMRSGVPNFCAVALALHELGYKSIGVRLDSGDLAYQSQQTRAFFHAASAAFSDPALASCTITASNDINEDTLDALNKQARPVDGHMCAGQYVLTQHACGVGVAQGHEIDVFGIGTHLVTCYRQPALGCVYKLVELNSRPRIKLSEDVTIPGRKRLYRLYGREGFALVDLLIGETDVPPKAGERILCRHPFLESKRAHVVPTRVEPLHHTYWAGGGVAEQLPSLEEVRATCARQLAAVRPDHLRALNPTPYKVSVSDSLYDFIHHLWLSEAPVGELT
eukprot:SM000109S14162  [mRNA]  locus=s109:295515:299292:+ [translate_table: standard]